MSTYFSYFCSCCPHHECTDQSSRDIQRVFVIFLVNDTLNKNVMKRSRVRSVVIFSVHRKRSAEREQLTDLMGNKQEKLHEKIV